MANYDMSKLDEPPSAAEALLPARDFPPPDPRRFEDPFIRVPEVHNFRRLAPYRLPDGRFLRTDLIFRSGEPSGVTAEGEAKIASLGIASIFDLRSADELARNALRNPVVDVAGTARRATPVFGAAITPEMYAEHLRSYGEEGTAGFVQAYATILEHGRDAYRAVFEHVRDRPRDGLLVHCTAGKDRTGVVVALALELVGVADQDIADEYALTLIGLSAWSPTAYKVLIRNPVFGGDEEKVLRTGSAKKENLLAFLDMLREKWGGAEGYLRTGLGFGDEDIARIKENLITQ